MGMSYAISGQTHTHTKKEMLPLRSKKSARIRYFEGGRSIGPQETVLNAAWPTTSHKV